MYQKLFLSLWIIIVVVMGTVNTHGCGRLLMRSMSCCKNNQESTPMVPDEVRTDCLNAQYALLNASSTKKSTVNPCGYDTCVGEKLGFVSSDGTFNREVMADAVEKSFENHPELIESIRETCIYTTDLSKFGKKKICDLIKIKICIIVECEKLLLMNWNYGSLRFLSASIASYSYYVKLVSNYNSTNLQITIVSCDAWKNDGYCQGMKDLAQICNKHFE